MKTATTCPEVNALQTLQTSTGLPDAVQQQPIDSLRVPVGQRLEPGKLYLRLFHGRDTVDEELDNWGFQGPTFGPLDYFHTTYLATFYIGRGLLDMDLLTTDDLFCFEGKYYGDLELFIASTDPDNIS